MKFKLICLSGGGPGEEIEAVNIKEARRIVLGQEVTQEDLNVAADLQSGNLEFNGEKLESLYEYDLDPLTCRSFDTIRDWDVYQVLEGMNLYVVPEFTELERVSLEYEGDTDSNNAN